MLEKLTELITQYIDIESNEIEEESRFIEDIGFNSYDFMCMLGDCEDAFDVEIDEAEAANSKTVGELIAYIGGLK
ncbi:MAG: phosphopantetheine-binding protein [Clostridium sp.]|nr:phosphopantetheine-binding protein [Clostridium sp.]MCM1546935.1 phosphopantetheine-binding protein [Ruminococcus sp.]